VLSFFSFAVWLADWVGFTIGRGRRRKLRARLRSAKDYETWKQAALDLDECTFHVLCVVVDGAQSDLLLSKQISAMRPGNRTLPTLITTRALSGALRTTCQICARRMMPRESGPSWRLVVFISLPSKTSHSMFVYIIGVYKKQFCWCRGLSTVQRDVLRLEASRRRIRRRRSV
jgi:hypothetical protein